MPKWTGCHNAVEPGNKSFAKKALIGDLGFRERTTWRIGRQCIAGRAVTALWPTRRPRGNRCAQSAWPIFVVAGNAGISAREVIMTAPNPRPIIPGNVRR